MHKSLRRCVAAYMLVFLASPGILMSQERSKLVDTGVIFSADQVESWRLRGSRIAHVFGLSPPYWTPVPEEIAQLEGKLKPYLESATPPAAQIIATRLEKYKRQYVGYTVGNAMDFCEWFLRGCLERVGRVA